MRPHSIPKGKIKQKSRKHILHFCLVAVNSEDTGILYQDVCITFAQRRPNVFDVGPTLYKCYTNVLCLRGYDVKQTELDGRPII